ncbi:7TM diverse intracellular signaling domain-containing protein [uncultured Aquimarina sp.]|uniref:7TM diverse intracellular signaling domain-containing protein n=1 Tax=uncultured Aquimarina sp. TaxID=575652 RepID=UPI0026036EC0|nr:7TM diverse intracellular signaling domain-containing protein [uncultured Aquimarina sp.]
MSKRQDVVKSDDEYVTLASWNVQKTTKLILDIKLLFYWNQWPVNEEGTFDQTKLVKPDTISSISTVWTRIGYPPKGFGTYRFFIKQEDLQNEAVLNFSRVLGACEVWINGKKQVAHGNLSKNLANSVDGIPALVVDLPKEEFLDVMLLISSSNSRLGGGFPLQNSINEKESFYIIKQRKFVFESLVTFLIIIFGIYQIFTYTSVHKEKYFLYFGLFCIFGCGRQLFVGEAFMHNMFPEISFEITQRLRYFCYYSGLGFFFLYHHYLFPGYFSRKVILVFTLIPVLGVVFVIVTPVFYGTYSAPFFQVFGLLTVLSSFWLTIKAIKGKKPFAKWVLLNLIIISVTFTNDILNAMLVIQTAFVVNMGFLAYVVFQMYLNHKIARQKEEMLRTMTLEVAQMNQQIQHNETKISKLLHESYYHLKSKRELADNLIKIKQEDNAVSINTILNKLKSELLEDNQLNTIKNDIEILNYEYLQRLKVKAPNLTETDLEICSYIYMGLNRNEISRLRSTTVEAIRKSRYRIRKKLELEIDEDLENYLKSI